MMLFVLATMWLAEDAKDKPQHSDTTQIDITHSDATHKIMTHSESDTDVDDTQINVFVGLRVFHKSPDFLFNPMILHSHERYF